MIALLLAASALCSPHAPRSRTAVAHFRAAHPCPGGPDKGSKKHCSGFVVDHIKPLCAGGPDDPSNMQYQDTAAGKAKDRIERDQCAKIRKACAK